MSDITSLSLTQTIAALKDKKFSLEELNKSYLGRIKKLDPKLNSFLFVNESSDGIPAAVKSLISTKGMRTCAGSKIIENYKPPFNATVIEHLVAQGVSVIGKTNQDEFAMGSSGENSAFGATKNPWNLEKVPGGSSSGSAAAVAADLAVFGLGTDTGGSIRQPASLSGVVGLKPSYGRVSRYGAIAMASSLDQIGPLAKSVEDARLILEWISGEDGFDSNCHGDSFKSSKRLSDLRGIRVGLPKEYFGEGLDPEVGKVIKDAIKKLEDLGANIVEVTLPNSEYALATYYIIMFSEVSSNLARFDEIRFGGNRGLFGPEPKRRIMLGTFALSTGYYDDYYHKAAKVRTLIRKDFDHAFQSCDVIVGPVSPTPAWNLGEKVEDPLAMYLSDIYTVSVNLAGIPGLSLPCGFVNGLPVGLQILGKYFDEETLLNIGEVLEKSLNIKDKPKL